MGEQRPIQEVQHLPLLQPQRLHNRQHAFDVVTAGFTLATKGILAPQHARSQQPLQVVIGRLYTCFAHEASQSQHVCAKGQWVECPGWPPGLWPVGLLTTGGGAWNGLADGGIDELVAFCPSRDCNSRSFASSSATRCNSSRHSAQVG